MTSSALHSNGQFPTLQFGRYPWWAKIYHGFRFLPSAFQIIQSRRLSPSYSFHLSNAEGSTIGISDGDIRYPGAHVDFRRLQPLIVHLEDKRFFSHSGVDLRSVARAIVANVRSLRVVQGGSTITQQLVRNTLLVSERSLLRKIFEVLLALKLERHYSKQEILDLYCEHVYLGKGIRGFPTAAKVIFRRKLAALAEPEVYGLLGLLRKPSDTYPEGECRPFLARQKRIAAVFKADHRSDEARLSKPNPINVANFRCARFTKIIRAELHKARQSSLDLRRVGLTIDRDVQSALGAALREISVLPDVANAAGIVVSTETADVLGEAAYEHGRDTHSSPSYFGSLQAGSTFKTFALLAALKQGVALDQPLLSAPFESLCYRTSENKAWRVRNYANVYRGEISLFDAFKYSDNTAFARLAELLDTGKLFDLYRVFGLIQDLRASPAIVLGAHTSGINLLSLVAAYRALANGGSYVRPRVVQYAEFKDGTATWLPRAPESCLVPEFQVLRDLQLALLGSGPLIQGIRHSGKTGTTRTGSLFAGYNDQVASAIWIGYGKPMQEGDPKAIGAVSVFERVMNRLLGHSGDLLSI